MADELQISPSAYSKIERGDTDPSIGRLAEIAEIIGVDITEFFKDTSSKTSVEDRGKIYGFVTKDEIYDINRTVSQIKGDVKSFQEKITAELKSIRKQISSSGAHKSERRR